MTERSPSGPSVVAFGAHPDDAELSYGGTLALWTRAGVPVHLVDLTAGERGSRGDRASRAREAREAASVLGVASRECLELPDLGLVADDPAQVRAIVEALRRRRPQLVLAPHPAEGHPDHRIGSALIERACLESRLARAAAGGERHIVEQIFFAWPAAGAEQGGGAGGGGNLGGGLVIDVTESFETKRAAIGCYRSQLGGGPGPATRLSSQDFIELVEARARVAGAAIETRFGEGFTWRGALRMVSALAALIEVPRVMAAGEPAPSGGER